MCTYLDTVGSTYYFRRVVPAELRPFIRTATGKPRTEFKISLGTKDRETAKRMLRRYAEMSDEAFDKARAQLAAIGSSGAEQTTADVAEMRRVTEELAAAQAERRAQRAPLRDGLLHRLNTYSTAELPPYEAAIKDILRERRVMAEAEAREVDPSRKPVSLRGLFEDYALAAGLKPGTAKEWRAVIAKLSEFLGHDDANRITENDLRQWRNLLLGTLPGHGRVRDPKTVRGTYLAAVKATLNWGVEQGILRSNPTVAVKVRVAKKLKLRDRDFTADEARRILTATLAPVSANVSAEHALARRWIPWLCAYTGSRVNEMSQLRAEDVMQLDGIWTIRVTPEAGTVKANEARTVPLHSHLIEQGFHAVAVAKGTGPLFYDPTRRRADGDDNRHFKKVGERLAEWVRNSVGIVDPAVQPNHGWRHTFKTASVRAGIEERVADAIQGHAPTNVSRSYGSVPLDTMAAAIEKLPRYDLG
jgi:integrase